MGSVDKRDEMPLEMKKQNALLKNKILKTYRREAAELTFAKYGSRAAMKSAFESALETALNWQSCLVEDSSEQINGITYTGPHKWIVCLLGSDDQGVSNFNMANKKRIESMKNLNISIMAASSDPLVSHVSRGYRELAESTAEGSYLNIVNTRRGKDLMTRFFGTMDVYPSAKLPYIIEFFQNA